MNPLRQMLFSGPVVEIGSGHHPFPQSHILVDKFLNNEQREASLQTGGRPLILADIEDLPFKDGAFAYSICAHVVEHADDIAQAFAELQRISRAGYIETPSALFEIIEPHRSYHRWILMNERGRLLVRRKPQAIPFEHEILQKLTSCNLGFKIFNATNPSLRCTSVEWSGHIDFEILDGSFHPNDYLAWCAQGAARFGGELAAKVTQSVSRSLAQRLGRLRKRYPLEPLICCCRCRGDLKITTQRLECKSCKGYYPREGEQYFLSRDKFTPSSGDREASSS